MKKLTKILGIALIAGLLLAGFACAVSATDPTTVTSIEIKGTLPTSITANTTSATLSNITAKINGAETAVEVTATWSGGVESDKYKYYSNPTITITIPTGYKLDSSSSITTESTLPSGTTKERKTDSTIEIKYPKTDKRTISSITIPSDLAPVVGGDVKKTITVTDSTTNFSKSASVTWKENDTDFSGSTFNLGKIYKATVTLNCGDDSEYGSTVAINCTPSTATKGTPNISDSTLTVDITYLQTTATSITELNITVTAPNAGTKPADSATIKSSTPANSTKINTISWKKTGSSTAAPSTFSKDDTYTVTVNLSPVSNAYAFDSSLSTALSKVKVNDSTCTSSDVSSTDGSLTVTYAFTSTGTTINKIAITGIDEPATGETPDTSITSITGNDGINIPISGCTVTWYKKSDTSKTAVTTFEAKTEYSVDIKIPTQTGYTYAAKSNMSATIGTDAASVSSVDSTNGVTITGSYTNTGETPIKTITISNIDDPVVGNKPSASSPTAKGNSSVSLTISSTKWYAPDSTTEMSSSSMFEANKKYKVVLVIASGSNYIFKDISTLSASAKLGTHTLTSSDMSLSEDKKTLTVTYTFPETNGTISDVKLSFTEPALDKAIPTSATVSSSTPSNSISSSPTITWDQTGTTFEGGKAYKATIIIKAKSGYTFSTSLSVSLNNKSCSSSEISINSNKDEATVTHTYSKLATPISSVAIKMDEPIAGKKSYDEPTSITSKPSSELEASITWDPKIPDSEEFDEETEYKATIKITNKNSDYTFPSSSSNIKVTVNGKEATVSSSGGNSLTATYKFDKTNKKGIFSLDVGEEVATIPYPKDFFNEIVALFGAIFDFDNWKIFKDSDDSKDSKDSKD